MVAAVSAMLAPPAWGAAMPARTDEEWMQQPDAANLLSDMNRAQADYEAAQRQQVAADKAVAALTKQIGAQTAVTTAASTQIQQYARSAYMGSANADNLGGLTDLVQADNADAFAQSLATLAYVGGAKATALQDAVEVLHGVQELNKRQQQVQAGARRAMTDAASRAEAALAKLDALLPTTGTPRVPVTPRSCPDTAPAGSLIGGSSAIGIKALCQMSVKQARSPAAAAAIVWAFNHLGVKYSSGGVPINDENFDAFNCGTFVAKAFYWGGGFGGFLDLTSTAAYASGQAFIQPIGGTHQSGDINIMWRSEVAGIAASGGQAGHAQLFIADGWVIQSGGISGITNVAPYPNGWPGWQETHFALNAG